MGGRSNRARRCGQSRRSLGRTTAVRPFVHPRRWRTPRRLGLVFVFSAHSRSGRSLPSGGIVSSSLRLHEIAAGMAKTSFWACSAGELAGPTSPQTHCRNLLRLNRHRISRHRCRPSAWKACRHENSAETPCERRQRIPRLEFRIEISGSSQMPPLSAEFSKQSSTGLLSHRQSSVPNRKVTAGPFVPKGKLCNRKLSFRNSGAVSRTETRPPNPRPRRLQ